jgi:hypothetical protein
MNALAISPDDRVVYLAGATRIRRWDLHQRKELAPFPLERMTCLAASEDGQLAAADHLGRVFDRSANRPRPNHVRNAPRVDPLLEVRAGRNPVGFRGRGSKAGHL